MQQTQKLSPVYNLMWKQSNVQSKSYATNQFHLKVWSDSSAAKFDIGKLHLSID